VIDYSFEDKIIAVISPLSTATFGCPRFYMGSIFRAFASAMYVYSIQLSIKMIINK